MIIIGLGNPGSEYDQTRHNVGFMVLDVVVEKNHGTPWKKEGGVVWSKIGDHLLIQPQEFMNLSGVSVKKFIDYKKIELPEPNNLLVVHDDLDFPLGEMHQQINRSAGGHNGVLSMIETLGTQNFSRLRIGIGNNRDQNIPAESYVLQKFSGDEKKIINTAVAHAVQLIETLIQ